MLYSIICTAIKAPVRSALERYVPGGEVHAYPVILVCLMAHVGTGAAAVYLEDSTSPTLPVSSSCSLLSGATRGAGLNYGKESDRDTDMGCTNVVCRPG